MWAVCMLYDNNVMQILFYMLPTLILMCHLGMVHPLRELRDNRIEMYNCFTIMCLSYCLMCYTPYVYDAEARYQIGFFMIGLIAQNLLVNIYLVGKDPLRMMILKCRHNFRNRKQIKAKWALKAQKTKMFFKRTFTRLTGSKKTDIDVLDASTNKKSAYALHTISEGSNEEDSNGEDNPIKTKQRKKQQKARELAQELRKFNSRMTTKVSGKDFGSKVNDVMNFYMVGTRSNKDDQTAKVSNGEETGLG